MEACGPSVTTSSIPAMVTSWATFQLTVVNVRTVGSTEASDASEPEMVKVTSAVGCDSRTTLTEPVVPASDTVTEVPVRVMPAVSSSVVVKKTIRSRPS